MLEMAGKLYGPKRTEDQIRASEREVSEDKSRALSQR